MKRRAAALTVAIALAAHAAYGDPTPPAPAPTAPAAPPAPPAASRWHVAAPWTLTLSSGTAFTMPPAYILPDKSWNDLDAEMKRLQDEDTRLTAENKSLETSLSSWQPGWKTFAIAVLGGVALGWYAHDKL